MYANDMKIIIQTFNVNVPNDIFVHFVHVPLISTTIFDEVYCLLDSKLTYVHYRSKVWGHPDNFMFSMKTHTFIHQMSCKMNRKYSQDIDEVRNYFYLK